MDCKIWCFVLKVKGLKSWIVSGVFLIWKFSYFWLSLYCNLLFGFMVKWYMLIRLGLLIVFVYFKFWLNLCKIRGEFGKIFFVMLRLFFDIKWVLYYVMGLVSGWCELIRRCVWLFLEWLGVIVIVFEFCLVGDFGFIC